LREINARDVLDGDAPDDSLALAGEVAALEARLASIRAQLVGDDEADVGFLADAGREVQARLTQRQAELADARRRAECPLSATWGEAQSLLAVLDAAADKQDVRLRLRAAFRRMIDSIWLLVVPRGTYRLAAVRVVFAGGEKWRDYLIVYRGGCRRRGACQWPPLSLADALAAGRAAPDYSDLRDRRDAAALERLLLELPLELLQGPALGGGVADAVR
jgi:hypothetical protein